MNYLFYCLLFHPAKVSEPGLWSQGKGQRKLLFEWHHPSKSWRVNGGVGREQPKFLLTCLSWNGTSISWTGARVIRAPVFWGRRREGWRERDMLGECNQAEVVQGKLKFWNSRIILGYICCITVTWWKKIKLVHSFGLVDFPRFATNYCENSFPLLYFNNCWWERPCSSCWCM